MNYIGCSGFMYNHWKDNFYPGDIPKKRWFHYYCGIFNTVELNVTFYRLPKKDTFTHWRDSTPENFVFSIKGSRYISHIKRLKDVSEAVDRFFERALELGEKLLIVLWQFPPQFRANIRNLEKFISNLRRYHVNNAFEFRNESWVCSDVEMLLKESGYCFCMADWPEFLQEMSITTDYIYIRRHGKEGRYNTWYGDEQLGNDKKMIDRYIRKGIKDVFIYFNNDYMGYAPQNALTLKEMLQK